MTRKQRIKQRNERVRHAFNECMRAHPQWKIAAILEKVAKDFPPLAANTVMAIVKQYGSYTPK